MTLTSTPLETLFFPIVQHTQALSKVILINTCILLQDPGRLSHLFLVHPTFLNLPPIISAERKSMLWTYLLTHWNLFPSSQWMALVTGKDSCISGLAAHHTRRPVSKVSHLLHHLLLPPILLVKVTFRISTSPPSPSLTTSLSLYLGSMRQSASDSLWTIISRMSW
jgi:hypothetical protein